MWQYILILHVWCIYYASRWHQWWWQHKSRNQSRVSSFGRLPTILLLQIPKNCPRKKIPLRDRRWKKKCFNKQFDLKILSLSKIFVKSGFFLGQIILELIRNGYFVKQGIFRWHSFWLVGSWIGSLISLPLFTLGIGTRVKKVRWANWGKFESIDLRWCGR